MEEIQDEEGRSYVIEKEIGKGGQGTVYQTENKKYVIKVIDEPNAVKAKATKAQLNFVRQQAINNLPIAKPLAMLSAPFLGYVMELAEDMIPLSDLSEDLSIQSYLSTGGILRRIELLRKLAYTLSQLHSKGLIYSDLSPENVFVSDDSSYSQIFLIDIDNLKTHSRASKIVYTPFYGAPELVKEVGVSNTYTDCWSFAVIAYELLTWIHPFIGDYVSDGEVELEEEALRGDIPWVGNPNDEKNICSFGIPSQYVIPDKLMLLFRKTFEEGIKTPSARPTMSEWEKVLYFVKQYILECANKNCKEAFFFIKGKENFCPFCDTLREDLYRVMICQWETSFKVGGEDIPAHVVRKDGTIDGPLNILENILLTKNQVKYLTERHAENLSTLNEKNLCKIEIHQKDEKILITPTKDKQVYAIRLQKLGEEAFTIDKQTKIPLFSELQVIVYFSKLDERQRVFFFSKMK